MLKFRHPGNLGSCLNETYQYLRPALENLIGHPVRLQAFSPGAVPNRGSVHDADGSLLIRLAGPNGEAGRTFVQLSSLAAADDHCRHVAGQFVAMCHRISREVRKSWDIKAQLIREEQFLWDNLVLGQFYRGNQKYNVLDLLGTAREASIFRYEGVPVRLGLLATWNWRRLRPFLEEKGCIIKEFSDTFDLRQRLKEDKASHLLTDGNRSFYVINSAGDAIAWISLAPTHQFDAIPTWEAVPKAYHPIGSVLMGRDTAICLNRHGEMLVFSRDSGLKWNRSGWHRLVGPPLSWLLADHLPEKPAAHLVDAAVRLSERRHGALFVIGSTPPAGSSGVAKQFSDGDLFNLAEVDIETVCQIGRIDGAVIVNSEGTVSNAGVILDVPRATGAGQGARTAAARVGSQVGIALKVSHDGPISIYRAGEEVRRVG